MEAKAKSMLATSMEHEKNLVSMTQTLGDGMRSSRLFLVQSHDWAAFGGCNHTVGGLWFSFIWKDARPCAINKIHMNQSTVSGEDLEIYFKDAFVSST